MCNLDIKNNRKKCVFKKRPIFPHSLLHYKVDIFSFLTVVLAMYCSDSEKILIIGLVNRQNFFSSLSIKGKIYIFKKLSLKRISSYDD